MKNDYPNFKTELQTEFEVELGEMLVYEFPPAIDLSSEGFPGAEVYVAEDREKSHLYPPFMTFDNSTWALTFKPVEQAVQGRKYYYSVVIKEIGAEHLSHRYYCSV